MHLFRPSAYHSKHRFLTVLYIVSSLLLFSCAHKTEDNQYKITGSISGLKGSRIYIQARSDSGLTWIDSAVIKDEHFELKGQVKEPGIVTLFFTNSAGNKEPLCNLFYLENREITLKGDIRHRADIQLSGAKEDEIRKKIEAATNYPARYSILRNLFYQAETHNRQLPEDSVNVWRTELTNLEKQHSDNVRNAVKSYTGSYAALHMVLDNASLFTLGELTELSTQFHNLQNSPSYQNLMVIINLKPNVSIGHRFQDFTLPDSLHKMHEVSSFQSKWVLIDFWASWCAPCRKQIPALKQLYARYKNDHLTIISISIDQDTGKWKNALTEEQMKWPNLITPTADWASKYYLVTAIPCTILLDSARNIVAKDISITEIGEIIKNNKPL